MFEVKLTSQAERAYKRLTPLTRRRVDRVLEQFPMFAELRPIHLRAHRVPFSRSLVCQGHSQRRPFVVQPACEHY